jgi:mannosyl-3-phosphoglycerate phosphatase
MDSIIRDDEPFIVIFTDLDGTLLDHESYEWGEAKPAIDLCKKLSVPIVLVSSKTRAEMNIVRKKLGISFPFISENGGGIFFPDESANDLPSDTIQTEDLRLWPISASYEYLQKSLSEIRDVLGYRLKGFSEMTITEISGLTGLDHESSRMAALREFDEPFIVQEDHFDIEALRDAAKNKGLMISQGGRFFHLHGKFNKGDAVKKIISWYCESSAQVFSVALGDSPNDFSMLEQVDQPVLIRSSLQFKDIEDRIPGIIITPETGPQGWNSTVINILNSRIKGGSSCHAGE